MKRIFFALIASVGLLPVQASEVPRGDLIELHSCELFAGGCTVSAEATQGGRYMLRVWQFTGGEFNGVKLSNLRVALLQSSPDNLAAPSSRFGDAVVYLPKSISTEQRSSLVAWLKSAQGLKPEVLHIRDEALQFEKTTVGFRFSVGDFISVETRPLEKCDARSCGEELWYTPRSAATAFGIAVNRASTVREPLLKLNWSDSAQRSIFIGTFGESAEANRNLSDAFCGLAQNLNATAGYRLSPTLVTR